MGAASAAKCASRPGRRGHFGCPMTIRGHEGSGRSAEIISSRAASRIATWQPACSIARSISLATPRLLTSAATPPIEVIAIRLRIHSGQLPATTATLVPGRTPNCSRKALAKAAARANPSAYVMQAPASTIIGLDPKSRLRRKISARLRGAPLNTC
jgi:hypothetical protein